MNWLMDFLNFKNKEKSILLKRSFTLSTMTSISNLNNHSKTKLFQIKSSFNKLGLIIYVSSARIIDHIGAFCWKFAAGISV